MSRSMSILKLSQARCKFQKICMLIATFINLIDKLTKLKVHKSNNIFDFFLHPTEQITKDASLSAYVPMSPKSPSPARINRTVIVQRINIALFLV